MLKTFSFRLLAAKIFHLPEEPGNRIDLKKKMIYLKGKEKY